MSEDDDDVSDVVLNDEAAQLLRKVLFEGRSTEHL